ncbi:hypothetical protein [Beggiatoa leptomitoformis]|uniref:Uncharacterized protein n=1 Tax=Beggiatoa leptomitoformis TaxID=288004 RepID=A0A2N9YCN5_9GAMM|nr:hypothetical protein [Beggiatoa leptomitoformis]ALG66507.1 hypothetical protein AL038_00610 [Beggiatoa leptomitoformis]AUI68196.1 hypothetical protein BLE401_05435 [Beggiatoa leptomitoformis]
MKKIIVIATLAVLPTLSFAGDIENNVSNLVKGKATVLSSNGSATLGAGSAGGFSGEYYTDGGGIGLNGTSYGEGLAGSVEIINNCTDGGCKNNIVNKLEGEALVIGNGLAASVKIVNNK